MIVIWTVFFGLILVKIIQRLWYSSRWDHIPGNKSYTSIPLIGHAYIMGKAPLENLEKQRLKHGNIFRMDVGNFPTVWLCEYQDISDVMRSKLFKDRIYEHLPIMVTT